MSQQTGKNSNAGYKKPETNQIGNKTHRKAERKRTKGPDKTTLPKGATNGTNNDRPDIDTGINDRMGEVTDWKKLNDLGRKDIDQTGTTYKQGIANERINSGRFSTTDRKKNNRMASLRSMNQKEKS